MLILALNLKSKIVIFNSNIDIVINCRDKMKSYKDRLGKPYVYAQAG